MIFSSSCLHVLLYHVHRYELIRMALAATNVDTMFGAVQFNQFRRNIKKDPVTTQVTVGCSKVQKCTLCLPLIDDAL
jgi:hypothetical protein